MNKYFKIAVISAVVIALAFSIALAGQKISNPLQADSEQVLRKMTVVVDAGHGGIDPGAISADGTLEKDINLALSECLSDMLKAFGFNVVMTRTEDGLICDQGLSTVREMKRSDINNRLDLSEKNRNSILISIHQNKFSQSKYNGTQVFYSVNNPLSKQLAQNIQSDVSRLLQPQNNRQIKSVGSEIYLLYHSTKPAVMVECGFISNPDELKNLLSEKYQSKLSFSILNSILNFGYEHSQDI